MVRLVATSVVRGAHQGESHGGVFLIDLERQDVSQVIDSRDRGADRSLRGIAFDDDRIYIAASDELFAYTPEFKLIGSFRSPFLNHCHEIAAWDRKLYLASAGYDSILGFDLDRRLFDWAMYIETANFRFRPKIFDPMSDEGPLSLNKMHINSVFCNEHGMYVSGLRTGGMLHFNGKDVNMSVELPVGTHNARPFRDGVLFNDSEAQALRYTGRGEGEEDRAMKAPQRQADPPDSRELIDDQDGPAEIFRGLCVMSDRIVAGGTAPSTVTVYDMARNKILMSVNLSRDPGSAIHSIALWPFD